MTKTNNFDVLVVYSQKLAKSASGKYLTPFPPGSVNASYNQVYAYFLETCNKSNINAAFTTSADIIGSGLCSSFWLFRNHRWLKVNQPCFSANIFDKFSPTNSKIRDKRNLLFSSDFVKPFNDPNLFELFFDKQKTYKYLSKYSIPSIALETKTLQGIIKSCKRLSLLTSQLSHTDDFSTDLIMKDRFGAGGHFVYKIKAGETDRMLEIIRKHPKKSFIIQPFAIFDLGFSYRDCRAPTDIRFVYLGGKIVQSYIRVAKKGDFRCNEHVGGTLTYLPLINMPPSAVVKSTKIARELNMNSSLFALDFIISNNGNAYLLEGNSGPGLDWDTTKVDNELEAKKLISMIIKELAVRIQNQACISQSSQTISVISSGSPL